MAKEFTPELRDFISQEIQGAAQELLKRQLGGAPVDQKMYVINVQIPVPLAQAMERVAEQSDLNVNELIQLVANEGISQFVSFQNIAAQMGKELPTPDTSTASAVDAVSQLQNAMGEIGSIMEQLNGLAERFKGPNNPSATKKNTP